MLSLNNRTSTATNWRKQSETLNKCHTFREFLRKGLKWVTFNQVIHLFKALFIFICTFNLMKRKFPDFILSLLTGFIHVFDFIPSQSDNPRFYDKLTFQKHNSLLDILRVFAPDQTPGIFEPGFFGNGSLHQFVVVFLFKFLSEHRQQLVIKMEKYPKPHTLIYRLRVNQNGHHLKLQNPQWPRNANTDCYKIHSW